MRGEGDDDYELVAKEDLAALREEVEQLKKNPVQNYESSLTLIEAMDRLADQVSRLLELFDQANKQMHEDYQKGLHAESQKLDTVISQNEKIARGILALAEGGSADDSADAASASVESGKGSYPLRGPDEMGSAPWSDSEGSSRRSLMKEFR